MSILGVHALGAPVPLGAVPAADSGITDTDVLFYATREYFSLPTDKDANRQYAGIVVQPFRGGRSVIARSTLSGGVGSTLGEIEFANPDGLLDGILTDGAIDGRPVAVYGIKAGESLDNKRLIFAGIASNFTFDTLTARLAASSRDDLLRAPVQTDRFLGTGGAEGGADLTGKPKPAAFGKTWGVTPIYLGVISGKQSYLASGGTALPINDVPAFYDRGVALTQAAAPPSSGEFSIDTATGIVTIGGTRPELPTCDIEGYAPSGTFHQTTADIIKAILEDFVPVSNIYIDHQSFTDLNTDQSAVVGIWTGTEGNTALSAIQELLGGISGFGGFNRLGKYRVGRMAAPSGVIRAVLDETNIVSTQRLRGPDVIEPPPWLISVGYKKNYTVTTDIASSATEAQTAFMQKSFREVIALDGKINSKHLRSVERFQPGLFATSADPQTEADRLLAFFPGKVIWRFRVQNVSPNLDIGETAEITHSRFSLNKRLGTVLGININLATREAELEVLV